MTLAEPVSSRIYLLHGFSGLVIQFTYYARTLAMPERLLCPNAYYARTLTMPEHLLCPNTYYARIQNVQL